MKNRWKRLKWRILYSIFGALLCTTIALLGIWGIINWAGIELEGNVVPWIKFGGILMGSYTICFLLIIGREHIYDRYKF